MGTFQPTPEYLAWRLSRLKSALAETKATLRVHRKFDARQEVIEAHEAQIAHYEKKLVLLQA